MATVVLTKAEGYTQVELREAVCRALDTLNYDFDDNTEFIVIKPNLCYYWDYSTGETTDPNVVSAVIDWVRERIGENVCILVGEADASAMRTKYAYKMLGYEKLSHEKNVKLVNLSEGEIVDREVVVAGEKLVLPVNKVLLDAHLIINVPKMKFHRVAWGLTCAMKNMFGAIAKPRKYVYHPRLAYAIVGINKIIKTNIILVDGITVIGKKLKKMGIIMAGDDVLAVDVVAANAMSYEPSKVAYLKLAMEEKIGDIDSIDLIESGVRLRDIKKEFPRQNYWLQKVSWHLQLKILGTYARLADDVVPPTLEE